MTKRRGMVKIQGENFPHHILNCSIEVNGGTRKVQKRPEAKGEHKHKFHSRCYQLERLNLELMYITNPKLIFVFSTYIMPKVFQEFSDWPV